MERTELLYAKFTAINYYYALKWTKQLRDAREVKIFRQDNPEQQELNISAISTSTFSDYDSDGGSSFDPENEALDEEEALQKHATDWVLSLSRDDLMSLNIVLFYVLMQLFKLGVVDAATCKSYLF